jgi:alkylation response protein AidB-like acyl-CoA dehydrogenase
MASYIQDNQFGRIVDYEEIRNNIHSVYDLMFPEYNLLAAAEVASDMAQDDPSYSITIGASALAYSILVAAGETEMASNLKDKIFTLGWTEEHTGSDLLSLKTHARPLSDDPDNREYHITGSKWLINCSYHADYHVVLAKVDPNQDGPRSLSFFLVPHEHTKNWERIETHVLTGMVLTKYEIDGTGTLVGKLGHGLQLVQQMAMPSKYQCTYMGIRMMRSALPPSIAHLGRKKIFGNNPLDFTNVFRQMYDIILKAGFYDFLFHRAIAFNTDGFLQFHGSILKSFLLLRINELLSKNLLVVGSKGFTRESPIGHVVIDSFVLPVFDGHYTINTLMTTKHAQRYLYAETKVDMEDRLQTLRDKIYIRTQHNEIENQSRAIRKPPFFDYAHYLNQFRLPLDIDPTQLVQSMRDLLEEISERGHSNDPEHRYKMGDLIHWMESILAAAECWKLMDNDHYLNAVVIQYNGFVNLFNEVISEGDMSTDFMTPARQRPLPENIDDIPEFLLQLLDVRGTLLKIPTH